MNLLRLKGGNFVDILIVVDMQKDFIDGSLGTKEAKEIVGNMKNLIDNFHGKIIYTADTHYDNYLETQEGKNLPVKHCIKGTDGHKIYNELYKNECEIIEKVTFGSSKLIERLNTINNKNPIDTITLAGLCTDICVISNALTIKTFFPEIKIKVASSCCAGVSVQSHNNALEAMKVCQIEII